MEEATGVDVTAGADLTVFTYGMELVVEGRVEAEVEVDVVGVKVTALVGLVVVGVEAIELGLVAVAKFVATPRKNTLDVVLQQCSPTCP